MSELLCLVKLMIEFVPTPTNFRSFGKTRSTINSSQIARVPEGAATFIIKLKHLEALLNDTVYILVT